MTLTYVYINRDGSLCKYCIKHIDDILNGLTGETPAERLEYLSNAHTRYMMDSIDTFYIFDNGA